MSIAPRYIKGAECGLCSLLETILGPLWVFLVYKETPPVFTLIGGCLLVSALALHEVAAARDEAETDDDGDDAAAKAEMVRIEEEKGGETC